MMSETAFFVKDVVGPNGCVSIKADTAGSEGASADVDSHSKTEALRIHHAGLDAEGNFEKPDEIVNLDDEPDHDELCLREQEFFLKAIQEDADLTDHLDDAVNSLRIVLAADQAFREGRTIEFG
jgi:hypothetical protein